jgi:hypothetical protein
MTLYPNCLQDFKTLCKAAADRQKFVVRHEPGVRNGVVPVHVRSPIFSQRPTSRARFGRVDQTDGTRPRPTRFEATRVLDAGV